MFTTTVFRNRLDHRIASTLRCFLCLKPFLFLVNDKENRCFGVCVCILCFNYCHRETTKKKQRFYNAT